MKNVLSFSLWSDNPKYTVGAIRNAELAQTLYEGWVCRFYVGTSTPEHIVRTLAAFPNVEMVRMQEPGDWRSLFWRFQPCSDPDVQVMVSRDTDSRLSRREKEAVNEWLESRHGVHIMRDHPWHGAPILGGMWGYKQGVLPDMSELIEAYSTDGVSMKDLYQVDQFFLRDVIYRRVRRNAAVHDEFFDRCPFPTKRRGLEFVGEVFDQDENGVQEHRRVLQEFLRVPTKMEPFLPHRKSWTHRFITRMSRRERT
ncbi:MAG: hypothetical protein JRG83_22365 [Deltaproteobacteria bacterium]|nr:hypothetical protein [Deltaproteobacteria bacterium]